MTAGVEAPGRAARETLAFLADVTRSGASGSRRGADDARELVGEQAYRMLRIYWPAAPYNFARADVTLYQTLLLETDDGASGLPLIREDWYG